MQKFVSGKNWKKVSEKVKEIFFYLFSLYILTFKAFLLSIFMLFTCSITWIYIRKEALVWSLQIDAHKFVEELQNSTKIHLPSKE